MFYMKVKRKRGFLAPLQLWKYVATMNYCR